MMKQLFLLLSLCFPVFIIAQEDTLQTKTGRLFGRLEIPAGLESLFRKSVQPYLISWFRYNPAKEIAKLNLPVLIIQGTTDIQVGVKDAGLLFQCNPSAKKSIIEGMNHVLKEVSLDQDKQILAYSDPDLPVIPRLIEEISSFITEVLEKKKTTD